MLLQTTVNMHTDAWRIKNKGHLGEEREPGKLYALSSIIYPLTFSDSDARDFRIPIARICGGKKSIRIVPKTIRRSPSIIKDC